MKLHKIIKLVMTGIAISTVVSFAQSTILPCPPANTVCSPVATTRNIIQCCFHYAGSDCFNITADILSCPAAPYPNATRGETNYKDVDMGALSCDPTDNRQCL